MQSLGCQEEALADEVVAGATAGATARGTGAGAGSALLRGASLLQILPLLFSFHVELGLFCELDALVASYISVAKELQFSTGYQGECCICSCATCGCSQASQGK